MTKAFSLRLRPFLAVGLLTPLISLTPSGIAQDAPISAPLEGKVLFLGDSITHAGHTISMIEATLLAQGLDPGSFELINLGLPSEGVTGLTEPGHPFPRPNLHERLDRALAEVKPDLVFACYGMNDGIYHPFSEERFAAYKAGINTLIEKVAASGAPLILMTPPAFDPEPLRTKGQLRPADAAKFGWIEIYENYDSEVIAPYATWILEQKDRVLGVIDLRSPVLAYMEEKRKKDPHFTLSNDGVHINEEGHRVLAKAILKALGKNPDSIDTLDPNALAKVHSRQTTLHNAWLTHVGHQRPQTKAGLPLGIARLVVALPASESPRILFNGADLAGWQGDTAYWSVTDGTITGRNTGAVPSSTYLFTEKPYRHFRLLFEVKQTVSPAHSTMHSAIAALGERFEDAGGNAFGFRGPLLMFAHDWGIWDAYRRNRIEPKGQKGTLKIPSEKVGDWNRIEILVTENRIRFVNNGELVFDFTDEATMLQPSPIGLQLHKNDKPQEFQFRGLVLTESPEDHLVTLP
ncbi:MAG: DUF1080 domain-containing protein [Verrucomicrobiales bacterium]|jgi:lysophospholipase L1-like esterase|nr:DUF1080 domain-containing protein [Verrucomicrobiales bacterium]